jgi:hypothetical protein
MLYRAPKWQPTCLVSRKLMPALELLGMCLAVRQKERLDAVFIDSKLVSIWVKADKPLDLTGALPINKQPALLLSMRQLIDHAVLL